MLTPYQNQLVLTYAAHVHGCLGRRHPTAEDFAEWLVKHAAELGLDFQSAEFGTVARGVALARRSHRRGQYSTHAPDLDEVSWADDWPALARIINDARDALDAPEPDAAARNLRQLGERTELSALDVAILEAVLAYETVPIVESLFNREFLGDRGHFRDLSFSLHSDNLPGALGESQAAIVDRFAPDKPLIRTGLASLDDDQDVNIEPTLRRLTRGAPADADVRELLLGRVRRRELEWSDFDHLGECRDDLALLLRGALEKNARGVNVLVYGPPGTGKTEFCHVLARHVRASLFSVDGAEDDGRARPRRWRGGGHGRIDDLRRAQSLLAADRSALLLFEEMDGLANSDDASKVLVKRLLEEAQVPTLWTAEDPHGIDRAFARRMVFAVEMPQPSADVRARIWSRHLASRGIGASEQQARQLAAEFDAAPGVVAASTAAAALGDGSLGAVRCAVQALLDCGKS